MVLLFSLPEKDCPCAEVMHISLFRARFVLFSEDGAFAMETSPQNDDVLTVSSFPIPERRENKTENMIVSLYTILV